MFKFIKPLFGGQTQTTEDATSGDSTLVRVKETADSNFAGQTGKALKYDPDGYILLEMRTRLRGIVKGFFHLTELDITETDLEEIKKLPLKG